MVLSNRERLIQLLSQNMHTYVSGQWLSNKLGISRTAVWKQMKHLEEDGYHFKAVPNKGYRLIDMPDKVSENTLFWGMDTRVLGQTLEYHDQVESTQDLAHIRARENAPEGYLIVADSQLKGRGRLQRRFQSENKNGGWFSFILRPDMPPLHAQKLTLITAIALIRTIKQKTTLQPQIKWPNDVLINGKKLAGILTEMQAEQDRIHYMVIGVGININHRPDEFSEEIKDKVTSLLIETGDRFKRRHFIQDFLKNFEALYEAFLKEGFTAFKEEWEQHAFRLGEELTYKKNKQTFSGTFIGIHEDGALVVEKAGIKDYLYSAEIDWFEGGSNENNS